MAEELTGEGRDPKQEQIDNLNAALREARGESKALKEQIANSQKDLRDLSGFVTLVSQGGDVARQALHNAYPDTWTYGDPAPAAPGNKPVPPPPAPATVKLDPDVQRKLDSTASYVQQQQQEKEAARIKQETDAWLKANLYDPLEAKGIKDDAVKQEAYERLAGKYALRGGQRLAAEEVVNLAKEVVERTDPNAIAERARQEQLGRVTEPQGFVGSPPSGLGSGTSAGAEDLYAKVQTQEDLDRAFQAEFEAAKAAMKAAGVR